MSHTGSVIHEDESPGMIRVVTTGYAVSSEQGSEDTLVFRKAPGNVSSKTGQEERYIIYVNDNNDPFSYGDGVCFSLEPYNKWNAKLRQYINDLERSIPNKHQNFQFKYVATNVSKVPDDYILNSLFKFMSDFDPLGIEQVLAQLGNINQINLNHALNINLKGDLRTIQKVEVVDYQNFTNRFGDGSGPEQNPNKKNCYVDDFTDVIGEMNRLGVHPKSGSLPRLIGRFR
ncbi:MAG: hypothetical protein OEM26_09155 [Saprospiraceae bacterium]|nr:hypothetical protein [Saprospiraceae bacterium]